MNVSGTDGPPRKVRMLGLMCAEFVIQAWMITLLFLISKTLTVKNQVVYLTLASRT